MENVAPNNTQAVIKNCPFFLGRNKEHRHGHNQWGQHAQRQQHAPRHSKAGGGEARRGGDGSQWCSFRKSTMPSCGVTGEESGGSAFMTEGGPVQELGLRNRITGGLAAVIRALAMVAMVHYLWFLFGNSLYDRVISTNANSHSNDAPLAAIASGNALSELRGLRLYTRAILPDTAHETYEVESTVDYAYAATCTQNCSVGEKPETIPNTFENADNSYTGRAVVLEWGQWPHVDCGSTFTLICRLRIIRMVLAIALEYNLECWHLDYITEPVRPPPEPNRLVEHDQRTSGGDRLQKSQVGSVRPHLLGMGVTGNREKGTVTIAQDNYTKSLLERCGTAN